MPLPPRARANRRRNSTGASWPGWILSAKTTRIFCAVIPDSARGHLAYASFLNNIGDEEAAKVQNEKARQLDPKDPAAWNNLANYYGENGPITNAFVYYAKAIELDPTEPVYYQNLAVMVYLYRTDAKAFYHINEQQVFDKSLALYRKAMQLDPDNFPLVTDYAESYYGIRPLRTNDALVAWTNALQVAHDDIEREGVYIHLARIKMLAGRYAEARAQLDTVTNAIYAGLKQTLERAITQREMATNPSATIQQCSTNNSRRPIPDRHYQCQPHALGHAHQWRPVSPTAGFSPKCHL